LEKVAELIGKSRRGAFSDWIKSRGVSCLLTFGLPDLLCLKRSAHLRDNASLQVNVPAGSNNSVVRP
jgi:hypothetical protein